LFGVSLSRVCRCDRSKTKKRKKKKDVGFSIVFAAYDTVVITAEASLMRRKKKKDKIEFFL